MTQILVRIADKTANPLGETACPESASGSPHLKRIANVLRLHWPRKTPANVAFLTGVSERSVKFWLAGETRMTLENVAALLKTDAGFDILQAILGDECRAEWWVVTKTAQDIRKMRKEIKKQEDRIALSRAQLDLIDDIKK